MIFFWLLVGGYVVVSMLATLILYCACVVASRARGNHPEVPMADKGNRCNNKRWARRAHARSHLVIHP